MSAGVAGRPDLSRQLAATFAKDRHPSVRQFLADNPATPADILGVLITDTHPSVRDAAVVARDERICEMFAIDPSNARAIEALRDQAWWEMDADSSAAVLAKALFPNQ